MPIRKIQLTDGKSTPIYDDRIPAIDEQPTINSKNVVESDGIAKKFQEFAEKIESINQKVNANFIEYQHKDLSLYDVHGHNALSRNTANTYVVRNPGYYAIPLVYGNSIKDSTVNRKSFTSNGATNSANFVNYLGNPIKSPYINVDTDKEIAGAKLIWQTSPKIITAVNIFKGVDCDYMSFTVNSIPDTNGDALLAITDDEGTIMWSWMIWAVADDIKEETITNYGNIDYTLMSIPLGAIYANDEKTRWVTPHFQFGRKDPMCPPADYKSTNDMLLYNIEGLSCEEFGLLGKKDDESPEKTVMNAIRNPNKFFLEYDATSQNWHDNIKYHNYWEANNTAIGAEDNLDTAVKTIYDPCPVGYIVPVGKCWTGFTEKGANTNAKDKWNVIETAFNDGYRFKRFEDDTEGWFIQACGYRSKDNGQLASVGTYGYYCTSSPSSSTNSYHLYFRSSSINPLYSHSSRTNARSVLPAKEFSSN